MIDLVFLLLIALAVYKGYRKGLIVSLFSVIALVAGLAAAFKLSALTGRYIAAQVAVPGPLLPSLSFLVTFLIVALLVRLVARIIEKSVQLAMLGWINRLGGALLHVVLYTTLLSFALFFGEKTQWLKADAISRSKAYPYVQPWAPGLLNNLGKWIPVFKGTYAELEHFFEGIAEKNKP